MSTFKFVTMNNVDDPVDIGGQSDDIQGRRSNTYSTCVDLVNFDSDNEGNIAVRDALISGLIQQPVSDSMGSRNFWAVGNTVYCSVAGADDEDKRFSTVISLDDMITMIMRVDGGLYVGSTHELHYLHGTDPQDGEGFVDTWSLPYGVILGTGCRIKGEIVPAAGMQGNCCIFASHRGVIVGGPGGTTRNLSQDKVSYEYGLTGKSMVREKGGLVHYLFTTSKTNPAYNKLPAFTFPID